MHSPVSVNVNDFNKSIGSPEQTDSNESGGPGINDHLEYLKTDSNLFEPYFLDFLQKNGIDIKDDDDKLKGAAALFPDADALKDHTSNKQDCKNLLNFAHKNDDKDKNDKELSPNAARLLNRCLLWMIHAYSPDKE